jgi:hypothetical protein
MHRSVTFFVVLASLACGSCGGGGGGGRSMTVPLEASPELSGHMSASGDIFNADVLMFIGDATPAQGPEQGLRGFLSFDLGAIPVGADVTAAVLRVTQTSIGDDPYSLGPLLVDQVVYGGVLDLGAYDRSFPANQGFAVLSTDATLGPKMTDVTVAVKADIAAQRARSQFRLRFASETNMNGEGDQAIFLPDPSMPEQRPVLIVTYRP